MLPKPVAEQLKQVINIPNISMCFQTLEKRDFLSFFPGKTC